MSPFPVVRLQGRVLRSGIRVTRLLVRAPAGARVRGVCLGRHRGCPRRSVVRRSRSARNVVRLRRFERRLRPGAVIQVFVTAPQAIGKYVRFRVAQGRAPSRRDMCVAPAGARPGALPGRVSARGGQPAAGTASAPTAAANAAWSRSFWSA